MPKPPPQRRNALTSSVSFNKLFGGDDQPGQVLEEARLLPLDLIIANPHQSRQLFVDSTLNELAESVRVQGVLQPILVRPVGDKYQIVAGERRTRAAYRVGLSEIPAIIRTMTDEEAALATATENLQREDLDLEDEARQYQYLMQLLNLSQTMLAKRLGIQPNYLSERVRMLTRPDLMDAYRNGQLTWKAALAQLAEERTDPSKSYAGNMAHEDSTSPSQGRTERHNLSNTPLTDHGPGPYFRWIQQAMRSIDHIQPAIITPDERPIWAEQLRALEERARTLRELLQD